MDSTSPRVGTVTARVRPSRTTLVLVALWTLSGASYGCVLPFISVYAAHRGLGVTAIGLLGAATAGAAALAQPVAGRVLDRTGRQRTILCSAAIAGAIGYGVLGHVVAGPLILACTALGSIGFFSARIVVIAATLNALESGGHGSAMFARFRLCPSAGFTVTGTLGGLLLGHISFTLLFGAGGLLFLAVALSALALPPPTPPRERPVTELDEHPHDARLARRIVFTLALMSLLYGVVGSSSDTYLPLLIRHLHGSFALVGLSSTVGAVVEIPLMIAAGLLADRVSHALLLLWGMVVVPLRFALFAIIPSAAPLLGAQALDGWTFSVFAIVGIMVVAEHTPREERAWSLGLYSAAGTVGPIVGPLLAGLLAARAGIQPMFGLVALAGVAVPLSIVVGLWPLLRPHA